MMRVRTFISAIKPRTLAVAMRVKRRAFGSALTNFSERPRGHHLWLRRLSRRLFSISLRSVGKLCYLLRHRELRRALLQGVGAGIEHLELVRQLPLATVVDIGANVGQFSLVVRHVHPHARIIAFEPLAKPAWVFERVFADKPWVRLHRVAVGPREGQMTMHVAEHDHSSSLLPISERQTRLFPGTGQIGSEKVRVAPLHHFISISDLEGPAFLKIDVQGYEFEVLNGCSKLLSCFDYIYIEASFLELYVGQSLAQDIFLFATRHSFRLDGIYNVIYDAHGRTIQADLLFSRTK